MTEGEVEESEVGDGLVFHEGSRLTDLKIKQNLSIDYPRLEPLHHLKIELMFHFYKIRTTWTMSHWITLAIGFAAVVVSGWDFGINELSNSKGFYSIGIDPTDENSGISNILPGAMVTTLITLALWMILLIRLWTIFPLMRSQAVSLYIALGAAELSQYWAHGFDANFPFGGDSFAYAVTLVGGILIVFVCFILQRAVTETRDVHVEERHWHPDPRQREIAMRDHSLIAWSAALISYCVLVVIHAWSGAHYVAVRQPTETDWWWILKTIYVVSGLLIVWLMLHVLWYPQLMLGSGGMRIESSISRQIGGMQSPGTEVEQKSAIAGKCPDCGEVTAVNKLPSGEIEASCAIAGCNGVGTPGEKCSVCATRISSRMICTACNTSAPIDSHFSDDEAW